MGAFVIIIVFVFIWLIAKVAGNSSPNSPGGYQRLATRGLPARGILLGVSNTASGSIGVGLNKLQLRQVQIDIEVPGEAPYVATVTVGIPLNLVRDVLPGATVELRVDRTNRNRIAIIGPGVGFAAAALMTQGQINQGAA